MSRIFTRVNWSGSLRKILINTERILYMERLQSEPDVYVIKFDNGETLELGEVKGKDIAIQIEGLLRPLPPFQQSGYPRPANWVKPPDHRRRRSAG